MKLVVLLLFFIFPTLFAGEKAKVLFVRGDVTALMPGKTEAISIEKNMLLPEDTSILTKSKSIARLRFKDDSTINLGPNSMIVISKLPKQEANIVNVLTGVLKAEVNKKSPKASKTKMVLKTNSAVMGVRGTKFQASYNPKNKVTSLVTIEGEVKMAKLKVGSEISNNLNKIDSDLDDPQISVSVKPGKYSSTTKEIKAPTVPTNIAPLQFNLIAKSMGSQKKADLVMNDNADDKNASGKVNIDKDIIKYKAGGYVDFRTGVYVEPKKEAKFDKKTNTYSSKVLGKIDRGGNFRSLEPVKGKSSIKEKKKKSQERNFLQRILPIKYMLSLSYMPFSEKVELNDSQSKSTFLSKSAHYAFLSLGLQWTEKFSTFIRKGEGSYEGDNKDINTEENQADRNFSMIEFHYQISDSWTLLAALNSRTYNFSFEDVNNSSIRSNTRDLFALSFGAIKKLSFLEKHKLKLKFHLNLHEDIDIYLGKIPVGGQSDEESMKSLGLYTDISAEYQFLKHYSFVPSFWYEYTSHKAEVKKFSRNRFGLSAAVQAQF